MTFPGNLPPATVTGTLRDFIGTPLTSAVMTFSPSVKRVDDPSSGDQFYETTDIPTCTTDAVTGEYTVDLIPNNDPDETPINWLWHVHVEGEDNADPPKPFTDDYDILIPFGEPDVKLPAVIQNGNAPGTVNPVSLGMLVDVDLSTPPTNGQALIFDTTSKKWKPGSGGGGGGAGLPSGGDVGQIIVNTAPGDGDWDDAPTIDSLGGIPAPSAPADAQAVMWDAETSAWVAASVVADPSGAVTALLGGALTVIVKDETAGTLALRSTVLADGSHTLMWMSPDPPPAGGGFAVDNVDLWLDTPPKTS